MVYFSGVTLVKGSEANRHAYIIHRGLQDVTAITGKLSDTESFVIDGQDTLKLAQDYGVNIPSELIGMRVFTLRDLMRSCSIQALWNQFQESMNQMVKHPAFKFDLLHYVEAAKATAHDAMGQAVQQFDADTENF